MRRNPDPYLAKARRDEAEAAFSELLAKLRAGKARWSGREDGLVIVTLDSGLLVHLYEKTHKRSGEMSSHSGHIYIYDFGSRIGRFIEYMTKADLFSALASAAEQEKFLRMVFVHEFTHFQRWRQTGRDKFVEVFETRYPTGTDDVGSDPKYVSDPYEHESRFQASIRSVERYLADAVEKDRTDLVLGALNDLNGFIRTTILLPGADPNLAVEFTPANPLYRNAVRWFATEYQRLKAEYADAYAEGKALYAPKGENDREW